MGTTYMKTAPATKTKTAPIAVEPTEFKGPTALYTLAAAVLGGTCFGCVSNRWPWERISAGSPLCRS